MDLTKFILLLCDFKCKAICFLTCSCTFHWFPSQWHFSLMGKAWIFYGYHQKTMQWRSEGLKSCLGSNRAGGRLKSNNLLKFDETVKGKTSVPLLTKLFCRFLFFSSFQVEVSDSSTHLSVQMQLRSCHRIRYSCFEDISDHQNSDNKSASRF